MKYIIAYSDTYNLSYFCGFDQSYRNTVWLLRTSRKLKDAEIFNTHNDAQKKVKYCDPDLSEHDILAIPEKELFVARLKG